VVQGGGRGKHVCEGPTPDHTEPYDTSSRNLVKLGLDQVEVRLRSLVMELSSLHRKRNNLRAHDRFPTYIYVDPRKFGKAMDDIHGFEHKDL
jgi:hypothetical protein